ncbi:ABC transporter ATP-binding protein [Clostridium sp. UBA1056]|uniref:ABC transporter ATP-binding protein/permease n=1 Tax=unclassified Clostridium TaxID=2614128 RepID=UPI00321747A4
MFNIKNVSKKYNGEFALNNVSLTIGKGLNFIVGASGSGKTTLLKIISGMEQHFDGNVFYCGKDIKALTSNEKSYFYNNVFGFVWQDFNLLEDLTVLENILLPGYLKANQNIKTAEKVLKDLKLLDIAQNQVKYLSGGQKQRVAIARELMKNPQVIIADEPTSALDEKTSKEAMDILRAISKSKTVIVVTHDTSLINKNDNVFELDKGELITPADSSVTKIPEFKMQNPYTLSFGNAVTVAKTSIKRNFGRFAVSVLTIMIAAVLLLTTFSGSINSSGQAAFNKLFDTYGESILDISIVNSFTSAGGTDDNKNDSPNADVSQDIGGLYEKYVADERVEFTAFLQAFENIKVNLDGKTYKIDSTGSVPTINKLISGRMPKGADNEVVVPESFLKKTGLSNDDIIGKEIEFSSSMYNLDTGSPVLNDAKIKAKIVGVADTTVIYEYNGEMMEYSVDDSFFFSKAALDDMRSQASFQEDKINFLIRAKTPADMIALKDELNKSGIVPIGRFELVEDIVRLNSQTTGQSGSASIIIGLLSFVMVIAIFLIIGVMRKREYAIYKISGFGNGHLSLINLAQTLTQAITAIVLLLITSPLINLATKALFGANILSANMLFTGAALGVGLAIVAYSITSIVYMKTNIISALKTGDR